MKKIAFLLSIVFCLVLTACGNQTELQDSYEEKSFVDYITIDEVADIHTILQYSSNVVLATLSSASEFDEALEVYTFTVDTDYTNNTPEDIHVYDTYSENYKIGHSYYLFLEQYEDPFYPHPIFTTVAKDLILDTTAQKMTGEIKNNGLDMMLVDIPTQISDALENGELGELLYSNNQAQLLSSDTDENMYNQADIVAKVQFANENEENPYISGYDVFCIDVVKGSTSSVADYIFLAPGLLPDTDYYLFLVEDSNNEGTYMPIGNAILASDFNISN